MSEHIDTGVSTRIEQETLLRTSAADQEWDFYSRDPKFIRRLQKRGYPVQQDHQGMWSCKIPLKSISIRRRLTPEEQEARRRMAPKTPFKRREPGHDGEKTKEPS